MEVWKDIEGFEGLYLVSNLGRIRSLDRRVNAAKGKTRIIKGKVLNPYNTQRPDCHYKGVILYKNTMKYRKLVHRIVAEAFIPNPMNYPCVNHKDENRFNNSVENLEWCDVKYNNNYGTRLKRMGDKHIKRVKCLNDGKIYKSIKEASESTGIIRSSIGAVCNGRMKRAKGKEFRFE